MEQYNEIIHIVLYFGQFKIQKMKMYESIFVSSFIEKLPPSWKDFKHMLKHKKEELYLVKLGIYLQIKEGLRVQESGR